MASETMIIENADDGDGDGDVVQDMSETEIQPDAVLKPSFQQLSAAELLGDGNQMRKIAVPSHRYTQLKSHWVDVYTPIIQALGLQIRMNTHSRTVEIKTGPETKDTGALQKAADFVRAFMLGFSIEDAIALIRLDDLYIDSFEIADVRQVLQGDHLSRAIGRIAGKDGKTKFTIENATRTRIVLADRYIHILGSFQNIRIARDAVVSLILGSPPNKVYSKLRTISSRVNESF